MLGHLLLLLLLLLEVLELLAQVLHLLLVLSFDSLDLLGVSGLLEGGLLLGVHVLKVLLDFGDLRFVLVLHHLDKLRLHLLDALLEGRENLLLFFQHWGIIAFSETFYQHLIV